MRFAIIAFDSDSALIAKYGKVDAMPSLPLSDRIFPLRLETKPVKPLSNNLFERQNIIKFQNIASGKQLRQTGKTERNSSGNNIFYGPVKFFDIGKFELDVIIIRPRMN